MATIFISPSIATICQTPKECVINKNNLEDIVKSLFDRYPSIREAITKENGTFNEFIGFFVDNERVDGEFDKITVSDNSEIFVMSAIAGG